MGLAVGVALGAADGIDAVVGVWTTSAEAVSAKVTAEPPVKIAISGVRRLKWPVMVTVTDVPNAPEQEGVQVMATSAGATVTQEPAFSWVAAQTTRLDSEQAPPAMNDVGWRDASTAASRAALETVIRA